MLTRLEILMYFVSQAMGLPIKPSKALQVQAVLLLGRAIILYPPADLGAVPDREAEDISHELRLLDQAISSVRSEIRSLDEKCMIHSWQKNALYLVFS